MINQATAESERQPSRPKPPTPAAMMAIITAYWRSCWILSATHAEDVTLRNVFLNTLDRFIYEIYHTILWF